MIAHAQQIWKHSVAVAPRMPALRPAARATFCLAVPLLILASLGRMDWAMYAGFGAFFAVFGRYDNYAVRFWQQLSCGAVQVASMLLGTLFSFLQTPFIVDALVLAVIAFGSNLVSRGVRWLPPGPIFAVFAGGACLSVPASGESFIGVLLVGAGTALFSLLVMLGLSARRGRLAAALKAEPTWAPTEKSVHESVRMGIAVLLAGVVAYLLGGDHWYWASLGAISGVMGATVHSRVARALQRCVGTCIGVLLTWAVFVFEPNLWVLLAVALVGQFCIEVVILRNYAVGMVFMTMVALLMVHLASPEDPMVLLVDRVTMTVLGAATGAALSVAIGIVVGQQKHVEQKQN